MFKKLSVTPLPAAGEFLRLEEKNILYEFEIVYRQVYKVEL